MSTNNYIKKIIRLAKNTDNPELKKFANDIIECFKNFSFGEENNSVKMHGNAHSYKVVNLSINETSKDKTVTISEVEKSLNLNFRIGKKMLVMNNGNSFFYMKVPNGCRCFKVKPNGKTQECSFNSITNKNPEKNIDR